MQSKLPQEAEFNAWGLSKIAVRNIVVFFILTLLVAISTLARVIVMQHKEVTDLHQQMLIEKDKSAQKIEQLKDETMKILQGLNRALENQGDIKREIQDTKQTLNKVQKRITK